MRGDGHKTLVGQAAREEWLGGTHPFGRSGAVHFFLIPQHTKLSSGVQVR